MLFSLQLAICTKNAVETLLFLNERRVARSLGACKVNYNFHVLQLLTDKKEITVIFLLLIVYVVSLHLAIYILK